MTNEKARALAEEITKVSAYLGEAHKEEILKKILASGAFLEPSGDVAALVDEARETVSSSGMHRFLILRLANTLEAVARERDETINRIRLLEDEDADIHGASCGCRYRWEGDINDIELIQECSVHQKVRERAEKAEADLKESQALVDALVNQDEELYHGDDTTGILSKAILRVKTLEADVEALREICNRAWNAMSYLKSKTKNTITPDADYVMGELSRLTREPHPGERDLKEDG